MKNITILGSTGSIGQNALKVIQLNPDHYRVIALAAGRNLDLIEKQIRAFTPRYAVLLDEENAVALRERIPDIKETEIFFGIEGFIRVATLSEVDTVISAVTGAAGLAPTYAAIKARKNIALANKETMVMAGSLIMDQARQNGVTILPIDSEHSAVLQSLQGHQNEDIKRVILTASGGPFRDMPVEEMEGVTPDQALNHPNWDMGPKITIDSATLMNKGLEVIEAKWLFDLHMEQIDILIHPQSIVHSMVEYRDGSVIAQMGIPHMMTPISYALSFPNHLSTNLPPLKLEEIGTLTFHKPDFKKFRCLDLAIRSAELGGSMPTVLNAANEIAVDAFLTEKIGFARIPVLIEKVMESHVPATVRGIDQVMDVDRLARQTAADLIPELEP